ncbi:MAG: DnaA/Hda family protein, partial [Pseudomonadota bacterium]
MDLQHSVNLSNDTTGRLGADFDSDHAARSSDVWARASAMLAKMLNKRDYDRWILPLRFLVEVNGTAVVCAQTKFDLDRVAAEFGLKIRRAWEAADPRKRPVRLECWDTLDTDIKAFTTYPWTRDEPSAVPGAVPTGHENSVVGPTIMRFETLVRGASNDAAITMAKCIATGGPVPASIIIINGSQGLGKTHLMKSIEYVLEQSKTRKVAYISAEEFYVAYVDGAQTGDT